MSRREMRALLTASLMRQDTMGATIPLAPESDTVLLQQVWLPEQPSGKIQRFSVVLRLSDRLLGKSLFRP